MLHASEITVSLNPMWDEQMFGMEKNMNDCILLYDWKISPGVVLLSLRMICSAYQRIFKDPIVMSECWEGNFIHVLCYNYTLPVNKMYQ